MRFTLLSALTAILSLAQAKPSGLEPPVENLLVKARDSSSCTYPSFKLTLGSSPAWGGGLYGQSIGDRLFFSTNVSTAATLFTLDNTTGLLYSVYGRRAYIDKPGTAAANCPSAFTPTELRFGTTSQILARTGTSGDNYYNVTCAYPVANAVLACQAGPASLNIGAWQMCYDNELPVSLVNGSATTGPYATPHPPSGGTPYCGKAQVVPQALQCLYTSTPA